MQGDECLEGRKNPNSETNFRLSNLVVMKAAQFQGNVSAAGFSLVMSVWVMRCRRVTLITPRWGSETMIHSIGTENLFLFCKQILWLRKENQLKLPKEHKTVGNMKTIITMCCIFMTFAEIQNHAQAVVTNTHSIETMTKQKHARVF